VRQAPSSGYWYALSRRASAGLCLALGLALSFSQGYAQANGSGRPVVHRETPAYSYTARRFHLKGTVKLEVLVASDGSVKSTDVVGGNPLLAEEARKAVAKWKWQPSPRNTKEMVEIRFEGE